MWGYLTYGHKKGVSLLMVFRGTSVENMDPIQV